MSNRTFFVRWFAALLIMFLGTACVQDLFNPNRGKVAISVKWPQKSGYSVQAIPLETERIEVTIQGEGIPDGVPMKSPPLTPNNTEETGTKFIEVPIGPKVIQAIAYGPKDTMIAQGYTAVDVKPNAITEARVVLQGTEITVPVDPKGSPAPGTSPLPTPSVAPPEYAIDTLSGSGLEGAVDSGDPKSARFHWPQSLAYDARRQAIYVADTGNRLIRRYDLRTGAVTTVAGQTPSTDSSPSPKATAAPALLGSSIGTPSGLAVGLDGALYFSDRDNHVIRKLSPDGTIVIVAGNGKAGDVDSADPTTASFYYPGALAFDANGTLYVADYLNHKIRRVSRLGNVTTLAGTALESSGGDGGPAAEAALQFPTALAVDAKSEYLYFAEGKSPRVRRIHLSTGVISTVAGKGIAITDGENGPALEAGIALPLGLAFTSAGELVIVEGWAFKQGPEPLLGMTSRVLKLTADGKLVRIAGQRYKAYGFKGDGGDATVAELNNPAGVAVDGEGRVIVADSYNNRLRVLTKPVAASPSVPPVAQEPSATAPAGP